MVGLPRRGTGVERYEGGGGAGGMGYPRRAGEEGHWWQSAEVVFRLQSYKASDMDTSLKP